MSENCSRPEKIKCYEARIAKLQEQLPLWRVDGVVIDDCIDIYYFTGLSLSLGRLLVDQNKALLLVDGRYLQVCKENCPFPVSLTSTGAVSSFYPKNESVIGFDAEHTSYYQYELLKKEGPFSLKPLEGIGKYLRLYKDHEEVELMRKSADLNILGFKHIRCLLQVGVSEKDLAIEYEFFVKKKGAEGLAFEPIIAFGPNSAKPHHRASNAKLENNSIVLIDIGATLCSYQSDMTRTFFFGKGDEELQKIVDIVKKAQQAALELCKPGSTLGSLDIAAREVMKKEGLEHLFVHSLGHGIGLETHEFPRIRLGNEASNMPLQEGMVVTIEPGLYIPGKGGARHEDTVIITKEGYQTFYHEDTLT